MRCNVTVESSMIQSLVAAFAIKCNLWVPGGYSNWGNTTSTPWRGIENYLATTLLLSATLGVFLPSFQETKPALFTSYLYPLDPSKIPSFM